MSNYQEIKLSSKCTILVLLMVPVLIYSTKEQEFHFGMVIGGVLFIALIGFIIYLFAYLSDARVIGDEIVLKKKFRPSKSYSFDKIGYPSSFKIKRSKYTTVTMTNEDKKLEKYLILNSTSILSFENKDAEQTLINLRNAARDK